MRIDAKCNAPGCKCSFSATVPDVKSDVARRMAEAFARSHAYGEPPGHTVTIAEKKGVRA